MRPLLPLLLLGACASPEPAGGFLFGQAWHMATAPHVFGDDVQPELAGCTVTSTQEGGLRTALTYDDRGRRTRFEGLDGESLLHTAQWAGPCRWQESVLGGRTDSVTTHTCVQGWPGPAVVTVDGVANTLPPTERRFDNERLTALIEADEVVKSWQWEGDRVVSGTWLVPELRPEPIDIEYRWDGDQMTASILDIDVPGAVTEWEYDDRDRLIAQYQDGHLFRTWHYDGPDPRPVRIEATTGTPATLDYACR